MKTIVITALACMLLSLGCAGRTPAPASVSPQPTDPAAYLKEVAVRAESIGDVSGFAKLRIVSGGETVNSRNVFFVKRPGQLRIETLGFLSRPALFFTADPARIQLYDIGGNTFFTGKTSAENFSRIIGMPLELTELVESFLGQPPPLDCAEKKITSSVQQDQLVFVADCGKFTERIHVDPAIGRMSSYVLFENGQPVYTYSFSEFQNSEGIIFPLKIEIYHYTYKTAVTLDFESLSFEPIDRERFSIDVPPNAQVLPLEELGRIR